MSSKRSKRSIALELLAWFLVAVATAVILVLYSNSVLAPSF